MPPPQSAVRLFVEHPIIARTLRGRLEHLLTEKVALMAEGHAIDFADYRERVGIIRGLREAIELCRVAEKDLNRTD